MGGHGDVGKSMSWDEVAQVVCEPNPAIGAMRSVVRFYSLGHRFRSVMVQLGAIVVRPQGEPWRVCLASSFLSSLFRGF